MSSSKLSWVPAVVLAILVTTMPAQPAHAQLPDHVYATLQEFAEQGGGDIIEQVATQAGYATTGEFLAAIPHSDVMDAIGAAAGGDLDAATHALTRGVTKVVVASGTKTFIFGAGAVGSGPIVAGVAAAILTSMVVDGVRDYRQRAAEQELSREIEAIRAEAAAVRGEDQRKLRLLEVERTLLLLHHQRMLHAAWKARLNEATDSYHRHGDLARYVRERDAISDSIAEAEADFHDRNRRFRDDIWRTIADFERELDTIRVHHEELQPLAHRPEVATEMRELYQRHRNLTASLRLLKNEIPDFDLRYPDQSIVFLVDCSASMGRGGKIQDAIAAVKQGVDATFDGNTEWALLSFASCNAAVVCAFTNNPDKVKAAANGLRTGGDTPLTFAVAKAGTYLARYGFGLRGRLVILADGEDNCKERGTKGPEEATDAFSPMYRVQLDDLPTRPRPGNR